MVVVVMFPENKTRLLGEIFRFASRVLCFYCRSTGGWKLILQADRVWRVDTIAASKPGAVASVSSLE
jgi:hypothetical protein